MGFCHGSLKPEKLLYATEDDDAKLLLTGNEATATSLNSYKILYCGSYETLLEFTIGPPLEDIQWQWMEFYQKCLLWYAPSILTFTWQITLQWKWKLRIYGTYMFNQRLDSIRISKFRDITKIRKNSSILKITRTFIFHN